MLVTNTIDIVINSTTIKWYEEKGYNIPKRKKQLYVNRNGVKYKNGIKTVYATGDKMNVKVEDLPPNSNAKVRYKCEECGEIFDIKWQTYQQKQTDYCVKCYNKIFNFKEGSDSYWYNKLIKNNPDAKCDISGETDKRFLCLHHLLSKSNGGKNTYDNYVILSHNYHMAFHHSFMGHSSIKCTPEDYYKFKEEEKKKKGENE